jgi:hypothetical protein
MTCRNYSGLAQLRRHFARRVDRLQIPDRLPLPHDVGQALVEHLLGSARRMLEAARIVIPPGPTSTSTTPPETAFRSCSRTTSSSASLTAYSRHWASRLARPNVVSRRAAREIEEVLRMQKPQPSSRRSRGRAVLERASHPPRDRRPERPAADPTGLRCEHDASAGLDGRSHGCALSSGPAALSASNR